MKGKKLILVLVLLVVCLAAYFAVKQLNLEETDTEEKDIIYINQTETDEIIGFSFVNNGETLSFTKDGETWKYDGNEALSMNQVSMTSMAAMVAKIEAVNKLEDHEAISEYGLDTPSNTITITTKEGTKELLIGNENEAVDGYYAMINGEDIVYLISSTLPNKFNCSLDTLEETETETEETEKLTETEEMTQAETSLEETE